MSNTLQIPAISQALIAAINAAWAPAYFESITIEEDDKPRSIQQLPFVELNALEVEVGFKGLASSLNQTNHEYRYEILLHFALPPAAGSAAGKIARQKSAWASAFIAQVQTGAPFAGIGLYPLITGVSFYERSPRVDGAGMMRIRFSCQVQADYA